MISSRSEYVWEAHCDECEVSDGPWTVYLKDFTRHLRWHGWAVRPDGRCICPKCLKPVVDGLPDEPVIVSSPSEK